MKKRNKGFTLIELIAVFLILAILSIIGISIYGKYGNNVDESILVLEEKGMQDAASDYYLEKSYNNQYKSNVKTVSGKKVYYSCVSLKKLISLGFYKKDAEFKNKNYNLNKTVVLIRTTDGVNKYSVIEDYTLNNDCVTWYNTNAFS